MPDCMVEFHPQMMVEGGDPEMVEEDLSGASGTRIVTIGGQTATGEEMLVHLMEIASLLPEMAANAKMPSGKVFTPLNTEVEVQIHAMLSELSSDPKQPASRSNELPLTRPQAAPVKQSEPQVHRSLFTLARAMNTALSAKRSEALPSQPIAQPVTAQATTPLSTSRIQKHESHLRVEEREGGGGQKHNGQDQQQNKKKKSSIFQVKASKKISIERVDQYEPPKERLSMGGIENIYIRFMALMARILGQAEAEAHQLYMKIKERTDQVDTLSLLLAKLNSTKKGVDWTKDEEMQNLVDKVREIGVDIPAGKYKWTEDEKRLLKENIQMRKDSMEKITQLERTDMQRYLQEASQCHQARSNVLKLMKEVIDTIIHNMRGG